MRDVNPPRTAATSKMERFVIMVNGFQPLTIITKRFILDVAAVLDPLAVWNFRHFYMRQFLRYITSNFVSSGIYINTFS